jgi:hypothetical protein
MQSGTVYSHLAEALYKPGAPEVIPVGDVAGQGGEGYQDILPSQALLVASCSSCLR